MRGIRRLAFVVTMVAGTVLLVPPAVSQAGTAQVDAPADVPAHVPAPAPVAQADAGLPADGSGAAAMDPDEFQPTNPVRLLDTREGLGAPKGTVGPRETITLQVAGRGGIPATGVGAVVLNITTTEATEVSFVTAWPADQPLPLASNVNTDPGTNTPNLAVVKLSADGKVKLYNNSGRVHLIADVAGWFPTAASFHPLTPARLLDTRDGTGGTKGPIGANATFALKVTGVGGVPASGVGSVVLNVTSTEATQQSYVTVWPHGDDRPLASNLNTEPGVNTPNLTFVGVGDGGMVDLFNEAGAGHLVADVLGWFTTDGNYRPTVPQRVLDTRGDNGTPVGLPIGPFGPAQTKTLDAPDVPVGAVVVNITSTGASEPSFVTAWPAGSPRNVVSNLNTDPGQNTPNLAIVMLGTGGDLSLFNNSGAGDLVIDILGWFPVSSTYKEISEPGFTAKVETPSTTKDASDIQSVVPSVVPSGPAVLMSLAGEENTPFTVGAILDLPPSSKVPGGFYGQITAVTPPDADGFQVVTAVPGTLEVVLTLGPAALPFQVDDYVVVESTPELPDGYLGLVTDVQHPGGGVQVLSTEPGRVEDAFLQLDVEIDLAEASAAGIVSLDELPSDATGTSSAPAPAPGAGQPSITGAIPLPEWDLSPDTLRNQLAGLVGLPASCGLTGLDIGVSGQIGYTLDISWRWTFAWKWPPVKVEMLVTANLTPQLDASIGLNHAGVNCSFSLHPLEAKFAIPGTKIGLVLWAGANIDVEAGVTGYDFEATASVGATVGLVENHFNFTPFLDAGENFSTFDPDKFDPNMLKPYGMVDVNVGAGAELFGKSLFSVTVGPFTEVGFTMLSNAPWWTVDLGVAYAASAGLVYNHVWEHPMLSKPLCATAAPYNQPTQPCRTPTPTKRINGDDDDRDFAPRLRWSAATALNPMVIDPTTLPEGVFGKPYSATLTTTGRYPATAWSLKPGAGSLPPGLTLDPTTGAIAGTPTAAGLYAFTVVAHDTYGGPIPNPERALTLRVWPLPEITTTAITSVLGSAFSQGLTASGTAPFSWQLLHGSLPPGMSWNASTGTISGTPTSTGEYFLTFKVTDAHASNTATLSVSVVELQTDRLDLGDAGPQHVDVSADGSVVAFDTKRALEPTDTNGRSDVYVFDVDANRLTRVSVGAYEATTPSISDDGRYVAYRVSIRPLTTTYRFVVRYDRVAGTGSTVSSGVTCALPSEPGVPAAHASLCAALLPDLAPSTSNPRDPVISGDGSHVAYVVDKAGVGPQVLVWNGSTGTTRIASMNHDGSANPHPECDDYDGYLGYSNTDPSLSYTGSVVTFTSDCDGAFAVHLGLTSGVLRDVLPDMNSSQAAVSGDGRYVVFVSADPDTPGPAYRYDAMANTATQIVDSSVRYPAIDHDGGVVTYQSGAGYPVDVIWVMTIGGGAPDLVSIPIHGSGPDGPSQGSAISADGLTVAFSSLAGDLTEGDTNAAWDVFVYDDHP